MEEVDGKTQAELEIRLSDNVRELVRQHIKEALEDSMFMGNLNAFPLSQAAARFLNAGDHSFQQAVRSVMVAQMNKY